MPRVVVVGDRSSGKTTFLTLLYAAQVKSGSEAKDHFRFHVTYESLEDITDAFNQIMSGSFPDYAAKEGIHELRFRISYRRAGLRIFSRLRSRGWAQGDSASFHFILLKNLEDELARFRGGSSVSDAKLRDILETDVIAILVDSERLTTKDEDRGHGSMEKYDAALESLVAAIRRSQSQGGRSRVHPMFIFSKFDSVEPEALRAAGVDGPPPEIHKTGPRATYARALLDHNLPRTMAKIEAREPREIQFAVPSYFFSQVHTKAAGAGRADRIKLRRSGTSGWEPDYSKDEYLTFLERLGSLASHAEN